LRFGTVVCAALLCCGKQPAPQVASAGSPRNPTSYTLTVIPAGSGAVTSAPAGIDCGMACAAGFAAGTTVALSAAPAAGWTFTGWDGACSGRGACSITVGSDTAVHARFEALDTPPPPPRDYQLRPLLDVGGEVTASPRGATGACPLDSGPCAMLFAPGTVVTLTARPFNTWRFTGWGGACSGTAVPCQITMNADVTVVAHFERQPFYTLQVSVQGPGKVFSTPADIDCGPVCRASFRGDAEVLLSALPAAGFRLAGWSGACAGLDCKITITGDATALVTFEPSPAASAACDGLVPALPLESLMPTVPRGACLTGTGDELGNFMLGVQTSDTPASFPLYKFFTIRDGMLVEVGKPAYGGDMSWTEVFSQPSGFMKHTASEFHGYQSLCFYSYDGLSTACPRVAEPPPFGHDLRAAVAVDPSGGAVAVASREDAAGTWQTTCQRFDKTGAAETAPMDLGPGFKSSQAAVNLMGDVLVFAQDAGATPITHGRWVSRTGSPLTEWFDAPDAALTEPQFLMDGSVVLRDWRSGEVATRFEDRHTSASPLPGWLQQRSKGRLSVIRGGNGYATWGGASACGAELEILTLSGESCGCIDIPHLTKQASVGRDGSLIAPWHDGSYCRQAVYPRLLR
jgi:hypothetical protein